MIDLGISKVVLIGVVALVVIGPQKLPQVARLVGFYWGRLQAYMTHIRAQVHHTMSIKELDQMRSSVEQTSRDIAQAFNADDFQDQTPFSRRPLKKNFRLRQSAIPLWFKVRSGQRLHVQSGACRVARFRPRPFSSK